MSSGPRVPRPPCPLLTALSAVSGTDEHGLKIQQAAAAAGTSPPELCERVSGLFRQALTQAAVSFTDFIRTSEPRHQQAVRHFWGALQDGGALYKGCYEGWYCTPEECFLPESQLAERRDAQGRPCKVSVETGHQVTSTSPAKGGQSCGSTAHLSVALVWPNLGVLNVSCSLLRFMSTETCLYFIECFFCVCSGCARESCQSPNWQMQISAMCHGIQLLLGCTGHWPGSSVLKQL